MIQILPIAGAGLVDAEGISTIMKKPEEILNGGIAWNIKRMTADMLMLSLQQTVTDFKTAYSMSRMGFDLLDSTFGEFHNNKVDLRLRESYGPVLASNFGLAMNAVISLIHIMRRLVGHIDPSVVPFDQDLVASLSESLRPIVVSKNADLLYPSTVGGELDSESRDILQSLVFSFNTAVLLVLTMLTAAVAFKEDGLTREQVNQLERLLRDWTLDVMIQVHESLGLELPASGPFDMGIPMTDEDRDLAEMGLDQYIQHLE